MSPQGFAIPRGERFPNWRGGVLGVLKDGPGGRLLRLDPT